MRLFQYLKNHTFYADRCMIVFCAIYNSFFIVRLLIKSIFKFAYVMQQIIIVIVQRLVLRRQGAKSAQQTGWGQALPWRQQRFARSRSRQ